MRPRAALEGKRDTARTCAPLAGHGAGALERVSPLERAWRDRASEGAGAWRMAAGYCTVAYTYGRTRRIHTRSARVRVETSASSVTSLRIYIHTQRNLRPVPGESIHTPDRHSGNNGTFKVRRQATGQVVVVVWWWCKIRETARLAANGALLDE